FPLLSEIFAPVVWRGDGGLPSRRQAVFKSIPAVLAACPPAVLSGLVGGSDLAPAQVLQA
nr:hypothetical protein [Bacillaceae bacterium]